mgnify:FL=1
MSDVSVKFGAVDNGLSETIIKIKGSLANLENQTAKTSSGIGSGFKGAALSGAVMGGAIGLAMGAVKIATASASAVVNNFGAALDMGGRLADLSARTGETAGNLTILERAFTNNGMEAEKVGTSINKLQKFMAEASYGGESQTKVMSALGLSMADLDGKTPTQQMGVFAGKIAGISDPTQRAAMAMEIFGKSGGEMIPLLSNFSSELAAAQGQLGSLPGVMDRSAAAFDTISDNFTVIKGKVMEFAAGFIEKATPALLTFTNYLAGVDAAGWGEKMMSMVLQVADTLMGAFKNPMGAIDALGEAMMTYAKGVGNLLMNELVTVSDFFKNVWASEIPTIITDMGKRTWDVFALYGEKALLTIQTSDAMTGFAAMVNSIFDGITSKFGDGYDFNKSMNRYVDAGLRANSELTADLDQKLNEATGSYSEGMSRGVTRLGDELGKVIDQTTVSATDFFGAVPAAKEVVDKLKSLEMTGKNFRESLTTATDSAKKDTVPIATNLDKASMSMERAAAKVKEVLTMSQQIMKDIDKAEKDADVTKGGSLDKKAKDATSAGDYDKARRFAKDIGRREEDQELRGVGKNRDNRSIQDLAKEAGIDRFGKTEGQLKRELLDLKRRGGELKPGAGGNTEEDAKNGKNGGGKDGKDSGTLTAIKVAAEAIQKLVQSLDKKLPQHALGA